MLNNERNHYLLLSGLSLAMENQSTKDVNHKRCMDYPLKKAIFLKEYFLGKNHFFSQILYWATLFFAFLKLWGGFFFTIVGFCIWVWGKKLRLLYCQTKVKADKRIGNVQLGYVHGIMKFVVKVSQGGLGIFLTYRNKRSKRNN